jgi:hypothetical protein
VPFIARLHSHWIHRPIGTQGGLAGVAVPRLTFVTCISQAQFHAGKAETPHVSNSQRSFGDWAGACACFDRRLGRLAGLWLGGRISGVQPAFDVGLHAGVTSHPLNRSMSASIRDRLIALALYRMASATPEDDEAHPQIHNNANPISLLERLYRLRLVSAGILWRGG